MLCTVDGNAPTQLRTGTPTLLLTQRTTRTPSTRSRGAGISASPSLFAVPTAHTLSTPMTPSTLSTLTAQSHALIPRAHSPTRGCGRRGRHRHRRRRLFLQVWAAWRVACPRLWQQPRPESLHDAADYHPWHAWTARPRARGRGSALAVRRRDHGQGVGSGERWVACAAQQH